MKDIQILTAASWQFVTNVFGTFSTPLNLNTKIVNNSNTTITVKYICISIKTSFLLFDLSKDILGANKNFRINQHSTFTFDLDVKNILQFYSANKKFTVKVIIDNNEVYQSDKISVKMLNDAMKNYTH